MVRMVPRAYKKKRWKIVFSWLIASILMVFGCIIASETEMGPSSNKITFLIIFLLSLIFFLIAGLFWISIALALRKLEE